VAIARESGDEGPNELLADGRSPLHQRAGNQHRHVFRVIRHDAVFVDPSPRLEVVVDEGFDVAGGCERPGSRHGCLLRWMRTYVRTKAGSTRSGQDPRRSVREGASRGYSDRPVPVMTHSEATPTVFVVDDDDDVRVSIAELLRSAGLQAESFATARE